jgi:hypothetical protein
MFLVDAYARELVAVDAIERIVNEGCEVTAYTASERIVLCEAMDSTLRTEYLNALINILREQGRICRVSA